MFTSHCDTAVITYNATVAMIIDSRNGLDDSCGATRNL